MHRAFDPGAFYAYVGAQPRERNALRQDLARGLKDYFGRLYGYDRYGAETAFLVPDRMAHPSIFGHAMLRILRDRRISLGTKLNVASYALEIIEYGDVDGWPFGLFTAASLLARHERLSPLDMRYALLTSRGEHDPFIGLEKTDVVQFFDAVIRNPLMPAPERLFWGHTLLARYADRAGVGDMITALLGADELPRDARLDVARAWVNARQPHLTFDLPPSDGSFRGQFVAEHFPFWIAHTPSWPTNHMVRAGLIWQARLGVDVLSLAEQYVSFRGAYADQLTSAVADILTEHGSSLPGEDLQRLIERGIATSGSSTIRRKYYRLGAELFGTAFLERARADSAGSVREWAGHQLEAGRAGS